MVSAMVTPLFCQEVRAGFKLEYKHAFVTVEHFTSKLGMEPRDIGQRVISMFGEDMQEMQGVLCKPARLAVKQDTP